MVWQGWARRGSARRGIGWFGTARRGTVRRGIAGFGPARHGAARRGLARRGEARIMTKGNRITINFSIEAVDWLNVEAKRRGLSVSELIRRIVDELRGDTILNRVKSA
jgi:hypothetical protein